MKYEINITESPYYAIGDGVTDNSSIFQKAVNDASNISKCTIRIPAGNYLLNSGILIANASSVQLIGEGSFGGTTLLYGGTTGDVITFNNCQHSSLQCMNIQYEKSNTAASGNAVTLENQCYEVEVHDVRMDYCYNGIWIKNATESKLSKIQLRYMLGDYGIMFGGPSVYVNNKPVGCYRAILDDISTDNPYPLACPAYTSIGNWEPNKTYNLNDIVLSNNCIYQCQTAGTSAAGTGPSGNGGGLRYPQQTIQDNSVQWLFVAKSITWIVQESNGYSLVISKAALIDGYQGYCMRNTIETDRPPMWVMAYDMECDHSYYSNMLLDAGQGAYITTSWFGSCLTGNAINIIPPFLGQVSIINSRISYAAMNGVNIGAASDDVNIGAAGSPVYPIDILLQNNFIGGNSCLSQFTYNGIVSRANGLVVNGNRIGSDIASPTSVSQFAGVFIFAGSENTIVSGNNLKTNQASLVYPEGTDVMNGLNLVV